MRQHWIFRRACGCPFGVMDAIPWGKPNAAPMTRSQAWREFYDSSKERNAAMDAGVTCDLMDHDQYVAEVFPQIRGDVTCPHKAVA